MWLVVAILVFCLSILVKIGRKFFFKCSLLNPHNKAIFISGCDTGIGHRLAHHFAAEGCTVFAGCLEPEKVGENLPENVCIIPLDVTSQMSINKAIFLIKKQLNVANLKLWCLINNAGICIHGEFDWLTTDQCTHQVEVNLLGTILLTKAFLPQIRNNQGRIINVTSVNGFLAYPGIATYSATKFGIEGFSDALRAEMLPHGVKVIVIQPADLARLTNIMSHHEDKAKLMWDAMDEEKKIFYSDYYRKYQEATMKNYGLTSPKRFEDSPILSHVHQAVLGKDPATRYFSAPFGFRVFYKLFSVLPDMYRDKIFTKLFEYVLKD